MKILVLNSHKNANLRILERHLSIYNPTDVISWNSQIKSAFDAFDEAKPDVIIFDGSMKSFLRKVVREFPSVRFVCEDNSEVDINEYDLTYTTIANHKFENKKYIPILFDIISYIQKNKKEYYYTDICFNQNIINPLNRKDFLNLFIPCTDIRINGNVRIYGPGCGGQYACGLLGELDQFSAYKQSRVCVSMKNYVNPQGHYEISHNFYNMLKVNGKVIHNIPEAADLSSFLFNNVKDLMDYIQKLVQEPEIEGLDVASAFSSCSNLMKELGFEQEAQSYLALDRDYRSQYK